jgi:extracellular elastinolytic metalloproteinase
MITSIATLLATFVLNADAIQNTHAGHGSNQIDVTKFRLQTSANYIHSGEVPHKIASLQGFRAGDYIQSATSFVKNTVPNASFRLVGDHYVGSDGVGHVYFKQTVNGLDIDNADFNVNVSTSSY